MAVFLCLLLAGCGSMPWNSVDMLGTFKQCRVVDIFETLYQPRLMYICAEWNSGCIGRFCSDEVLIFVPVSS